MKSANSMTRTGKQTTLQGNKTHTGWLLSILHQIGHTVDRLGIQILHSSPLRDCVNEIKSLLPALIDNHVVCPFPKTKFTCINKLILCDVQQILLKLRSICFPRWTTVHLLQNQGFWICFHVSKSCSLQ